jgi:PTS system glucose-specific IIA component
VALVVAAPLAGTVTPLAAVPDPVFADALVGPGLAIDPGLEQQVVVAPIAGMLTKLKPHAFVIVGGDGRAVLVHLGIDTVRLDGAGFTLLAVEGSMVDVGEPIVRWDPRIAADRGLSVICPVVCLDADPSVVADTAGGRFGAGDAHFTWA